MKYEEYEAAINKMISEPESAPVGAQAVLAALKEDSAALEAATAGIAERDEKIRALQDTNVKLFMSQAGPAPDDEPEETEKSFAELVEEKMKEDED